MIYIKTVQSYTKISYFVQYYSNYYLENAILTAISSHTTPKGGFSLAMDNSKWIMEGKRSIKVRPTTSTRCSSKRLGMDIHSRMQPTTCP